MWKQLFGTKKPRLFISYRRQDSAQETGRLFDLLVSAFGSENVFLDIANLELGMSWTANITQAIEVSDAVLAVIGPHWLGAVSPAGMRRLDDSQDFVRLQIAVALSEGKPVVPVLVNGASMPAAESLPDDIRALAERNAATLRNQSWDRDGQALVASLRKIVG